MPEDLAGSFDLEIFRGLSCPFCARSRSECDHTLRNRMLVKQGFSTKHEPVILPSFLRSAGRVSARANLGLLHLLQMSERSFWLVRLPKVPVLQSFTDFGLSLDCNHERGSASFAWLWFSPVD